MELATARSTGPTRFRFRAGLAKLAARGALVLTLLPVAGVVGVATPARAQTPVAAAGAASTTAAAAPADSLLFMEAPLDESAPQWKLAQALIQRAGFGSALDSLQRDLTDSSGQPLPLDAFLGGEAGIVVSDAAVERAVESSGLTGPSMADMAALLGTPAATQPAVERPAGWALILDARAPSTAFAGLSQAVADQASKAGETVQQSTYQGVQISYAPGGADAGGLAAARVDKHALVAQTPADLQPVIDTAKGTAPSIETVASYTTARQALAGDHLLFGFINAPAAMQAQVAIGGVGSALAGEARYTGFAISADQPGFRMETVSIAANGAPLPAGAAPYQSALLAHTPGDALFFLSAQDLAKTGVLDAIGALAFGTVSAGFGPAATPAPGESSQAFIAKQYEGLAALLGFNPQTELLQQLVGEYGIWVRGSGPADLSALFVSGVKDPGAVANALSQLTMLIQGNSGGATSATTRTVAGSRITTLPTEPGAPPLEYGVIGNQLVVGVGDAIDRFASPGASTLTGNAQYQTVMATLPTETNGSLYLDLTQLIPLMQASEQASSGSAATGATGIPSVRDASPDCGKYPNQAAAQKAYDALEPGTFGLDQNFNGVVCEDFFATPAAASSPAATPAMGTKPPLATSAVKAFALVAYDKDGMRRTSSILYIEGASS
ncbi:MAG TPA: DUF3352 domain-containing protein [Thermomicrobiales bacterium]|nr:DUF3352 domain-containing protein [Thermomicrobiales bacterium]